MPEIFYDSRINPYIQDIFTFDYHVLYGTVRHGTILHATKSRSIKHRLRTCAVPIHVQRHVGSRDIPVQIRAPQQRRLT